MKHTKMLARVLVCLLAMAMLLGTFVACTTDKGPGATTTKKQEATQDPTTVKPDYIGKLSIGRKVKMLGWGTEEGAGYATQYCGEENSQNAVF